MKTHSKTRILSFILVLAGALFCAGKLAGLHWCGSEGCQILQKRELWWVGFSSFTVLLATFLLPARLARWAKPLLVMAAAAEIFLTGYQVYYRTFCSECMIVACIVLALFFFTCREARKKWVAAATATFAVAFLLGPTPSESTPVPAYSLTVAGLTGAKPDRIDIFFDPRCGHCKELIEEMATLNFKSSMAAKPMQINLCPVSVLKDCSLQVSEAIRYAREGQDSGAVLGQLIGPSQNPVAPKLLEDASGIVRANTSYLLKRSHQVPFCTVNGDQVSVQEVKERLQRDCAPRIEVKKLSIPGLGRGEEEPGCSEVTRNTCEEENG